MELPREFISRVSNALDDSRGLYSVLKDEDKIGGNPVLWSVVIHFQNRVNNCSPVEMPQ